LIKSKEGKENRSVKEFLLDKGVFIFSLIGAVSILVRMFSWTSFLNVLACGCLFALASLWILDRKIFYYRLFISDEVLVSAILIFGCFIIVRI